MGYPVKVSKKTKHLLRNGKKEYCLRRYMDLSPVYENFYLTIPMVCRIHPAVQLLFVMSTQMPTCFICNNLLKNDSIYYFFLPALVCFLVCFGFPISFSLTNNEYINANYIF